MKKVVETFKSKLTNVEMVTYPLIVVLILFYFFKFIDRSVFPRLVYNICEILSLILAIINIRVGVLFFILVSLAIIIYVQLRFV